MSELLGMEEPRRRFAAMMSGLDIHYDLGEGHPLLGRRMPDLDLVTPNGPLRVFTLLHDARPVLLNLGKSGGFNLTPWAHRVQLFNAKYVGTWELPVLGPVTAPTAVRSFCEEFDGSPPSAINNNWRPVLTGRRSPLHPYLSASMTVARCRFPARQAG
jgi:hypothetical protein